MTNMAHWLFLPNDAVQDLVILAGLTPAQLDALRSHLDSHEFRLQYRFYIKVADLLRISDEAAAKLCTFLSHVHTLRMRSKKDASTIPAELDHFLSMAPKGDKPEEDPKTLSEKIKASQDQIVRLFSDLPQRDRSDKVRDLETGPLPHLHGFRTLCDVRPVYDDEASKITANLLVITMCLSTHKASSGDYEELVIQMTEDDVADMQKALGRLEKKLQLLKQLHKIGTDTPRQGV